MLLNGKPLRVEVMAIMELINRRFGRDRSAWQPWVSSDHGRCASKAAHRAPHLRWYEAIVLSLTSFHGRGFFPGTIQLGDPLAIVAALEAVSGLFIELVFIAMFSRRFLGE